LSIDQPTSARSSGSFLERYRSGDPRLVAGVMSGTSLDGIDVAIVAISGSGTTLHHELRGFHSRTIPAELKEELLAASSGAMLLRRAFELHVDLGALYAEVIEEAIGEAGLHGIDAVGLHGQTVYHAPARTPNGVTVQIGSGAVVAERLGVLVVNDFRSADVAAGGEGAPLVPYCDLALLHDARVDRVALNIGGIANLTWLPRGVTPDRLIAFDTGPGNMLIDAAVRLLRGLDFDAGGALAADGNADASWLEELLRHPYFKLDPPKSTGRELFGEEVGQQLASEGRGRGLSDVDILATLTMLTARSIALSVERLSAGRQGVEVIVGGGGARNDTLMAMLAAELPASFTVAPSDRFGIPSDAKEAICFAILANETLCEVPANVPSVTGAGRRVICGAIHLP
jgi:anhydro-N-acetylmuramic acid kinase